jgi:hypothetical protein
LRFWLLRFRVKVRDKIYGEVNIEITKNTMGIAGKIEER